MKTPFVRRCWTSRQFFSHTGAAWKLLRDEGVQYYFTLAVYVIPAGVDDFDAMIERAAEASFNDQLDYEQRAREGIPGFWLPWKKKSEKEKDRYRERARAVFASAGIIRPE